MSWAARLAALSGANLPNAVSADSADSPKNAPNGTIGTIGNGGFNDNAPHALPRHKGAIDTNGTIDKGGNSENRPFVDDPEERAAIQAEALPVQRRRKRMMSWAQPEDVPKPGDYCGCCEGQIWWTSAPVADGWCCCRCHPPACMEPGTFRAVAT
jgi:hypothetical protein